MSKLDKLIKKIFSDSPVSYSQAEKLLLQLGFDIDISGSHHIFRKKGYGKNISLKRRATLRRYQVKMLREVVKDHEK